MSLEHAALVEMLRTHPEMIPSLLRDVLGVEVPAHQTLRVTEPAPGEMEPIECRADLLVEFRDDDKRPVMSWIVEAPLRIDGAKYFSWPVHMAFERSRKRCETCLIVITPDPTVAAWARGPIRIGPGMELCPLVLGPAQIPVITDRELGLANPILAVLSALAHGNDPDHGPRVVRVAVEALDVLGSEDSGAHLICKGLFDRMREALKNRAALRGHSPDVEIDHDAAFAFEWLDRGTARMRARIEAIIAARERRQSGALKQEP